MTRTPNSTILSELRNPSSPNDQLAALKELKHDFIGHEQTKESWLAQGVISILSRILNGYRSRSKRRQNGSNGFQAGSGGHGEGDMEEETCFQAVILVGSLGQGGPPFLPALASAQVITPLLSMLSPSDHHPKLVLAVLRTLNTIADAVLLEDQKPDGGDSDVLKPLYSEEALGTLSEILDQESPELIVQQQISYTAGLINKTCRFEARRKLAVQVQLLDTLAKRLASFIVARTPTQYTKDRIELSGLTPATKTSRLGPILQAIATIIAESKSRAYQFVTCPIFSPALSAWRESRGGNQPVPNSALDSVLPPIPRESASSRTGNFPPLGGLATTGKHKPLKGLLQTQRDQRLYGLTSISNEEEAPLSYWLAHIAKEEIGHAKLTVAWVLAILFRAGYGGKRLERILSMQVIPFLVQMLGSDKITAKMQLVSYDNSILLDPGRMIKEQAPRVLALLVADNEELQFAAAEAGSVKKLAQLLKRSYDPLPSPAGGEYWSQSVDSDMLAKEYLGSRGQSPLVYHTMKMRESTISALAAMATFKDEYRKNVIDNGVVPFIMESLSSEPSEEDKEKDSSSAGEKILNPTSVLLAACEAATALSRSVSTLRTSLLDAGLGKPIFKLLKHQDIEVQIAATGAVCNIILEFSPMRDVMIESGVQAILCEHAHSLNAKLRLNSLWALKHLMYLAHTEMKKSCLEELGPGWLKQTICNDQGDSYGSRISGGGDLPLTMESSNAAGEPVDLLNSTDESQLSIQSHYEGESEEDEVNMIDSIGALSKPTSRGRPRQPSASILDDEAEAAAQAKRDDIAVQEQGLDFIRNLISGETGKELIDFVFAELGQEKLFDILAALLRPRPVDAFSRDRRSTGGVKHVPPHTEIIISVCFILVHLANGLPRHRQLLISHPDLLKLMVPIFNHSSSEARTACVWVVINLTWMDDTSDKTNARQRAFELRKLGIEQKLEDLKDDPCLDTRERVKTAKLQMQDLLKN